MPRPVRIQYENAFYHVMNRGRGRQLIFPGTDYFTAFLDTLEEAHVRFDAKFHAYCLMDKQYHLLLETPRANLDRIMRHINGVYTQRYNRLKHTDGPLFRGRYKAILIDEEAHLLQVGRYIHRSPAEVKRAAADILERHSWSSYQAYTNQAAAATWLDRQLTYQMLGHRHRYKAYRAFVEQGNNTDILQFYNKGNLASIMADKAFREMIKTKQDQLPVSGKSSLTLTNRPAMSVIVTAVAKVFKTTTKEIITRRHGQQSANLPRQMAIYCCQRIGDHSLKEIAAHFHLTHSGSVSPAISAIKKHFFNGELLKNYEKIEKLSQAKKR